MTSDDWVFERQRNYPLSYVLTGADREYLVNKRKSDHPKDDPEQRIQDQVEKLPDRIQDLIIDIYLLDTEGRISSDCLDKILDLIGDPTRYPKTGEALQTGEELHNRNFIFGYKLGETLQRIHRDEEHDDDALFLWGIVLSVIRENTNQGLSERKMLSLFDGFFEERIAEREEIITESIFNDSYRSIIKRHKMIGDILNDYDLDSNPLINDVLLDGISSDPIKSTTAFRLELEDLLTDTPLGQTNKLERAIVSDLKTVFAKEVQGISAQKVFKGVLTATTGDPWVGHSSSSIDRFDLNNELDGDTDQGSTTRALKLMAGKYDGYSWPQYPILTEVEQGWKVSAYGSLLAYCEYGSEQGTGWMYEPWEFSDSESSVWNRFVLPAVNEISSETYDYQSILNYNPHI